MSGINAFFHAGSVLATVLLVYLLLVTRRQRDLLRQLLSDPRRIHVATPTSFLERFAAALCIDFEDEGLRAAPAKINAVPWREMFVTHGIVLIRCKVADIEVHVRKASPVAVAAAASLATALGGQVSVQVLIVS